MRKSGLILFFQLVLLGEAFAQTVWVRYNQAGYEPCRSKRLIVMSNTNISGTAWNIKNSSNAVVLNGTLGASLSGVTAHMPKPFNYEIDFTSINTIGNYTFNMTGIVSPTLNILTNPYEQYADQVLRYFKVHRSGTADCLDHSISHLGDASCKIYRRNGTNNASWSIDNAAPTVDMVGGWYDAGDYIKFTLTTAYTAHNLLRAYEINPAIFQKKLYSQSNKVDILDEAKHGLEFLMKTMPSGRNEFIIQTGGAADHQQGNRLPENDALNGQREVYSAFSRTQMGYTAAALALGARIFASIGEATDAARYQAQAIAIFNKAETAFVPDAWWEGGGEVFYADNTNNENMALAAYELYRLTNTASYLTKAQTYANAAGAAYWAAWANSNMISHGALYNLHTPSQTNLTNDLTYFRGLSTATGNLWRLPHNYTWGSMYSFFDVANAAALYYLTTNNNQYNNMYWDVLDYTFGMNNWGMAMMANNTTLPSAITTSYSQYYKLQPALFPIGEIVQGPGDKATHDVLGFVYGATWENQFNTNSVVFFHRNNNYMTIETTITGVSDGLVLLALASKVSGCTPLPVTFAGFNAIAQGMQSKVSWGVSDEKNVEKYSVMHSTNGVDFIPVYELSSIPDNNQIKWYEYIHTNPVQGVNYYKIIQQDIDGNTNQTEVKQVIIGAVTDIELYPNPFDRYTTVALSPSQKGKIEIYDTNGKLLYAASLEKNELVTLGAEIPSGLYFLHWYGESGSLVKRLVKQ